MRIQAMRVMRVFYVAVVCACLLCPSPANAATEPPEILPQKPPEITSQEHNRRALEAMKFWITDNIRSGTLSTEQAAQFRGVLNRLNASENAQTRTATERALLRRLKNLLEKKVLAHPKARGPREEIAAYHAMLGEYDKTLIYLRNLRPASATDLGHFIRMLSTYSQLGDFKNAAKQLAEVQRLLAPRVPLRLSEPIFATTVMAYRLYKQVPRTSLVPGKPILLYTEIEGAIFRTSSATPTGKGSYELQFHLTIKDEFMNTIMDKNFEPYRTKFQGRVRDLHASLRFRVPVGLQPGTYHVLISCRDRHAPGSNPLAKSDTDFTILGSQDKPFVRPPAGKNSPQPKKEMPEQKTRKGNTFADNEEIIKQYEERKKALVRKHLRESNNLDPDALDLRRRPSAFPDR